MAYQVPNSYDPNAPTYLPGTQTEEEQQQAGAPQVGMTSAPKPYTPPTTTDYTPAPSMSTGTQKASDAPQPPQTFSQMQEQGIARPPAPSTLDPMGSGQQAVTGDANPQLAPSSTGMTTAQWDAYSPLSGMNEQQLAQYWAGRGATGLAYGATPTGVGANGVNTYNPAQVASNDAALAAQGQALAPAVQAAQTTALGNYNATNQAGNAANTQADWAAYANSVPGQATGLDPNAPPPASFTGGANAANGAVTQGFPSAYDPTKAIQPNNGSVDANGNYVLPGTTPTYLPPGGVSSAGGQGIAPTDQTPTQGGTQPPATSLPGGTTGTTDTPGTTPTGGAYDVLNAITQGAQGQGGGSAVQNATQQKTLDLLNNPSPYNEAAVKDYYNTQAQGIDDQYALQQKALSEEMARRGLGNSTIFGGNLEDLNIGKRTAKEALSNDLAHQFATSEGQYANNAINTGNTVGNTAQQAQQNWISQLMGYGQNAFQNDLATNQQNQNATNNWQNYILQLLGMGYSPTG